MDLKVEMKVEPVWLEETTYTSLMSNLQLPNADDTLAEVKIEPHVFADQSVEETGVSIVKEEYEIKVPNLMLPPADGTLAEVKSEPPCVFTNEVVEQPGVILLKEEYEIEDEKKETYNEAFNPLADTDDENFSVPHLVPYMLVECTKESFAISRNGWMDTPVMVGDEKRGESRSDRQQDATFTPVVTKHWD
ncbi:uncharacterized protein [Anabrus simplex]|uniref:uncharacterized protein isoform X2 n=1 Tax=Anabrus simplex TaxID=316456 RepID=UPI0035A3C3A5